MFQNTMPGNSSPIGANLGAIGGARALLLVYSPRMYDTQVFRPLMYGFTTELCDQLLGKGDTMGQAFKRADVRNSQEVSNAMVPDSNGIPVNMDTFNQLWTFMLMIDQPSDLGGAGTFGATGMIRTVLRGHCDAEPIATSTLYCSTPVVNKDCNLIVHTRERFNASEQIISAFGMQNPVSLMNSDDIVDGFLDQVAENSNLYLMTPDAVLSNCDNTTSHQQVNTVEVAALQATDRKSISSALRSPGAHLKAIIDGLDAQNGECAAMEFGTRGYGMGVMSGAEDIDQYKEGVVSQLSNISSGCKIQSNGIDVLGIFSIADIESLYPNLTVIPQKVASGAMFDLIPQTVLSPKVSFSAMIANAVPALAINSGLSSISFMYTSYDTNSDNGVDKSAFQVVPDSVALICPPNDQNNSAQLLKYSVMLFRKRFHEEIAPFVRGGFREFECQVMYSNTGETTVNLHFLDNNQNNEGREWYETPNRLGVLSSTSVGNEIEFQNNGAAINNFVLFTQGKTQQNALGESAFPKANAALPGGMEAAPIWF